MNRILILSVFFIAVLLHLSCSGPSSSPVSPLSSPGAALTNLENPGSTHLWGVWEVQIDPDNQTITSVPLRGIEFTCNVVHFLEGPHAFLSWVVESVNTQPAYTDYSVNVAIEHPFPGLDRYTGFDVLGVFMADGTDTYPGPDAFVIPGKSDPHMLNPDGYTRWFNAPEFTGAGDILPLVGFHPGIKGTPDFHPNAHLNPYRYFAIGLEKEADTFEYLTSNANNRGCFKPGFTNNRLYEIRFPSTPLTTFQYALIAHWEPGYSFPDPPPDLDDFPPNANADESVVTSVVDQSTLFYNDDTNFGGNVTLNISPWDWSAECNTSGVMEEYEIRCYSSAWTGSYVPDMTPISQSDNYCTFLADIPVEILESSESLPVWIEINYPDLDYTNEFGVDNDADGSLAGYFLVEIPVAYHVFDGWAITWGETGNDAARDCAVDQQGNIYVTGHFEGTVDFDPGPAVEEITSLGGFDVYLASYTPAGTFRWAYSWGGGAGGDQGLSVAVDDSGNVLVTGYFYGNVDFDPGPGIEEFTSNGIADIFLSKFDSAGAYHWAKVWGGSGDDYGSGVGVDSLGYINVAGAFESTVDFDPGAGIDNQSTHGGKDIFLSRFDSSGTYQWAKTWGASGDDGAYTLAVDDNGNSYVSGQFMGTIDFDPGPGSDNHGSNGYYDVFLSKFDSSGIFQWAKTWGAGGSDGGNDIAVGSLGEVYITGWFTGTVDFDPGAGSDIHNSNGERDVFLSKFDSSGSFYWARTWGGSGRDFGNGVEVDGAGYPCVGGFFSNTVDFDPGPGNDSHTSHGLSDACLSKFDSSGNFQWARTWGASENDNCSAVGCDAVGNIYSTGTFGDTVDFDPGPGVDEHTSNGGPDAFLLKLLPNGYWE